jgi:hypothetical protein
MDWWYPPAITTGVPATKQPPPLWHVPPTHLPFDGQSLSLQHWWQVPLQHFWPDEHVETQVPLEQVSQLLALHAETQVPLDVSQV